MAIRPCRGRRGSLHQVSYSLVHPDVPDNWWWTSRSCGSTFQAVSGREISNPRLTREESPHLTGRRFQPCHGVGLPSPAFIFVFRLVKRKGMPGYIERAANQVADILMREGLDYTQTKAAFKQARAKVGLHAPKEHRGSTARLTLEEELRFIDQAYAQGGQLGLMMQVLLETGTRVSEFAALRVEDVSLAERAIVIEDGGGQQSAVKGRCAPSWPVLCPCTSAAAGPGPCSSAAGGEVMGDRLPSPDSAAVRSSARSPTAPGYPSTSIPTCCATP